MFNTLSLVGIVEGKRLNRRI